MQPKLISQMENEKLNQTNKINPALFHVRTNLRAGNIGAQPPGPENFCAKHYDECRKAGNEDYSCLEDIRNNHPEECGYMFLE